MARKVLVALGLTVASLVWASGAQAILKVEYRIDADALATLCTGASGTACSGSVTGDVRASLIVEGANSNSSGTPAVAALLSSATSLTNKQSVTHTIDLRIGDTDFTAPSGGPLKFQSNIGGTVVLGGASNLLSFISCIDTANGQNVCPGTFNTPPLSPPITAPGAYAATNAIIIASLAGPYSISELIHFSLSGSNTLNYSASSLLTPVPEPVTMFLGGTGLLLLGFAARRRLFRRLS